MAKRQIPETMDTTLPEGLVRAVVRPECVGQTHPIYGYLVDQAVYEVPQEAMSASGPFQAAKAAQEEE
jgi:hypothetical protein